jgi:hypothetical protein
MAYTMKGAPMKRNFGIGADKPGPPNHENLIDQSREDKKEEVVADENAAIVKANPTAEKPPKAKNWWEEGYGEQNKESGEKYKSDGSLVTPEKEDYFSDLRPLQRLLGLSKEQRAARKLKKANALTEAKANVGTGNETYKGTKLIDKANKKANKAEDKKWKQEDKSDRKLANYNEKKAKKKAKEQEKVAKMKAKIDKKRNS